MDRKIPVSISCLISVLDKIKAKGYTPTEVFAKGVEVVMKE